MMPSPAFWIALLAMLVGLAGTVLPALPGVGLIWAAALIYAVADGFVTLTPVGFGAITILAALGLAADFLLSQAGSRLAGASWQALAAGIALGALGFLFGLFVGGIGAVPAGILGTLLGIFIVEYRRRRAWAEALRAGGGWLAGCVAARGLQFLLALAMIAIFVWQAGL